jgi:hypothetical protein
MTQPKVPVSCPICGNRSFDVCGYSAHGFTFDSETNSVEDHDCDNLEPEPDHFSTVSCVECKHDCSYLFVDRFGPFQELKPRPVPVAREG